MNDQVSELAIDLGILWMGRRAWDYRTGQGRGWIILPLGSGLQNSTTRFFFYTQFSFVYTLSWTTFLNQPRRCQVRIHSIQVISSDSTVHTHSLD